MIFFSLLLRLFHYLPSLSFPNVSPDGTDTPFISIFHICFMSDKKNRITQCFVCVFFCVSHKQPFQRIFCALRSFVVQLASLWYHFAFLVCTTGDGYQSGALKAQWCKCDWNTLAMDICNIYRHINRCLQGFPSYFLHSLLLLFEWVYLCQNWLIKTPHKNIKFHCVHTQPRSRNEGHDETIIHISIPIKLK